jgi:hypothetical protein
MSTLDLDNISTSANPATTNPLAANKLYVPCVPLSVSANLVAAEPLAKILAASVSASAPELAQVSLIGFGGIQQKKSELQLKVDECAEGDEALLEVCLLNVEDLFANLTAYLMALGQFSECGGSGVSGASEVQSHAQVSLKLVHDYAAAMGLAVSDYCVAGVLKPEMLFDACLKRVQMLQKRWLDNYLQSIELTLQLQRDAVFGAVASCLMEICQDGLDNQITLEPSPQVQEDVLVSLATFVDSPFSGEWPVLRQRVIVLGNKYAEEGVQ